MNFQVIRYLRERKQLSQSELAQESWVSERTIRDLEHGRKDNDNVRGDTLERLCKVLCPDDPETFWVAINNTTDYNFAMKEFNACRNVIPSVLYHPLSRLLEVNSHNATSYVVACFCGYLRALRGGSWETTIHGNLDGVLDVITAILQSSSLTAHVVELEGLTRSLICELRMLAADATISEEITAEAKVIVSALRESRLTLDKHNERIIPIRAAYYLLYDNWGELRDRDITYSIMSHISILCDNGEDTREMRCSLLYVILAYLQRTQSQGGDA